MKQTQQEQIRKLAEFMGWHLNDNETYWLDESGHYAHFADEIIAAKNYGDIFDPFLSISDAFMLEDRIEELGLEEEYGNALLHIIFRDHGLQESDDMVSFRLAHATPAQRSEAVLKVINDKEVTMSNLDTSLKENVEYIVKRNRKEKIKKLYRNPTEEERNSPEFNAVWDLIKTWDINIPEIDGNLYSGATGNHVIAILNALEEINPIVKAKDTPPNGKHKHERPNTCICYILALEPNENCPIHGYGEWPPRCKICGKFMPYEVLEEQDE